MIEHPQRATLCLIKDESCRRQTNINSFYYYIHYSMHTFTRHSKTHSISVMFPAATEAQSRYTVPATFLPLAPEVHQGCKGIAINALLTPGCSGSNPLNWSHFKGCYDRFITKVVNNYSSFTGATCNTTTCSDDR